MAKNWQIEINGDNWDLENLYKNQQSPYWSIIKLNEQHGEVFYLESTKFDEQDNNDDVEDIARELIKRINGVAKLRISDYQPIELHSVSYLDENGHRTNFLHFRETLGLRVKLGVCKLIKSDGTEEEMDNADILKSSYSLVEADKDVRQVLGIFSKSELSWKDLWDIFEIIESTGELTGIRNELSISSKEVNRFTQTCQYPDAIGEEARHARPTTEPPKKPMSLKEAVVLITRILTKWVDSRENR